MAHRRGGLYEPRGMGGTGCDDGRSMGPRPAAYCPGVYSVKALRPRRLVS